MIRLILPIVLLFNFLSCKKEPPPLDILEKLNALEGITVKELETQDHFQRLFEIQITQPVDHNQPNGNSFNQKIYLGHVGEDLPMVFETEGYARGSHRTRELAPLLNANQLSVEHRYYGESVPSPRDWQYLTIWQAANDHHQIVKLFKTIYSKAWVSSGASKGGDTAIFHRRFFPNDVAATVAYVAPILFEKEDQRFLDFYATIGNETCREKMKTFQRNALMHRHDFQPMLDAYVSYVNEQYNTDFTFPLPFENVIYHSIREDYPFEFWSSETIDCSSIPEEDASVQELFDHFVAALDIFLFFSDYGVEFWTPYGYQAKTELGNYAYDVSHLVDLEENVPPLVTYNAPTDFDPSVMADIQNWIDSESTNLILLYGADDPWTVGAIDYTGSDATVIKIINPGTKHFTRISNLSSGNQNFVEGKVREWLGL